MRPRARRPAFNEAPAERGGKPRRTSALASIEAPSMRPPLNAGENPAFAWRALVVLGSFNEAPAERGGKPGQRQFVRCRNPPSMRPRLNAGENAAVEKIVETYAYSLQ